MLFLKLEVLYRVGRGPTLLTRYNPVTTHGIHISCLKLTIEFKTDDGKSWYLEKRLIFNTNVT